MKLLHLSDLHLGKRVNGFSMLEDQRVILTQIVDLAEEEKVDAVLLAGDLYDKPVPPAEAVTLLDGFLTRLSGGGIPVVAIYALPYLKPALVRHWNPEADIASYEEAVSYALGQWAVDKTRRNVLLAHQFVTGGVTCESEERSVGGVDQIPAPLFAAFDYVALGHLHGPQSVGRPTLRYSGSPLKYSFSECGHEKSVTLVTLKEKGQVEIQTLPLTPCRDLREIRGTYEEVTAKPFYQGTNREDYLHVILTDEEDVPEAMGKLRTIYPNLMKLSYDNRRTQGVAEVTGAERPEEKTPLELFQDFYQLQNNQPMAPQQEALVRQLMETIWEGTQ